MSNPVTDLANHLDEYLSTLDQWSDRDHRIVISSIVLLLAEVLCKELNLIKDQLANIHVAILNRS